MKFLLSLAVTLFVALPCLFGDVNDTVTEPDLPFYPSAIKSAEHTVVHPAEQDQLSGEVTKLLGSIALFTIILLMLNWALKKINQNRFEQLNATSDIKVIEKRILSHKATVYLIEIRDKTVAIAESPAGVTLLTEFQGVEKETP